MKTICTVLMAFLMFSLSALAQEEGAKGDSIYSAESTISRTRATIARCSELAPYGREKVNCLANATYDFFGNAGSSIRNMCEQLRPNEALCMDYGLNVVMRLVESSGRFTDSTLRRFTAEFCSVEGVTAEWRLNCYKTGLSLLKKTLFTTTLESACALDKPFLGSGYNGKEAMNSQCALNGILQLENEKASVSSFYERESYRIRLIRNACAAFSSQFNLKLFCYNRGILAQARQLSQSVPSVPEDIALLAAMVEKCNSTETIVPTNASFVERMQYWPNDGRLTIEGFPMNLSAYPAIQACYESGLDSFLNYENGKK